MKTTIATLTPCRIARAGVVSSSLLLSATLSQAAVTAVGVDTVDFAAAAATNEALILNTNTQELAINFNGVATTVNGVSFVASGGVTGVSNYSSTLGGSTVALGGFAAFAVGDSLTAGLRNIGTFADNAPGLADLAGRLDGGDANGNTTGGNGLTFNFSGLDTSKTYRLQMYGVDSRVLGNGTSFLVMDVDGTSQNVNFGAGGANDGSIATFEIAGQNSATVTITNIGSAGNNNIGTIQALTLFSTVPEPSSAALLGLGGLALLLRRRKG